MTDFHDLDLPKAKPQGEPPDAHPRFGNLLVESIFADAEIDKPNAVEGARFRHSNAGACSRKLAYAALNVPVSNPADAPGHYIMWLGDVIHEAWQKALQAKFPDADIELKVGADEMGGHIDGVVKLETGTTKPYVISIELKTQGGYAFKMTTARFNGPPTGPKIEHKCQAALNAKAVDADECVIVYLARDPNNWVDGDLDPMLRVVAEWTYTREQYEPIADTEAARVHGILRMLDDERLLPARKVPELALTHPTHRILDPAKGEWATKDGNGNWVVPDHYRDYWGCGYCSWQETCAKTGAEREPIDVLVQIGALDGGQTEARGQGQHGGD